MKRVLVQRGDTGKRCCKDVHGIWVAVNVDLCLRHVGSTEQTKRYATSVAIPERRSLHPGFVDSPRGGTSIRATLAHTGLDGAVGGVRASKVGADAKEEFAAGGRGSGGEVGGPRGEGIEVDLVRTQIDETTRVVRACTRAHQRQSRQKA